jgi:4-hydroxy-tetrahydrodipicolinate reductase
MNFTLLGFGKMGRMISGLALPVHKIVSIIDQTAPEATHKIVTADALQNTDVVIDFSHPSGVLSNVGLVAQFKKNIVMGTTGWHEQLNAVRQMVEASGIGFLFSSNFSIGVQLFLKIVERAGELFNTFDQYDVFAHEFHHRQKADSPSGTALSVGKTLLKTMSRKKEIFSDTSHEKIAAERLHLTSTRGGSIPGTHEVFFDSEADTVEIRHTARSRAGFAAGALKAAQWLHGKRGFFTMDDYLNDILKI